MSTYATSYEQTTTVTHIERRETSDGGIIDKAYIRGISGFLKLIEAVSSKHHFLWLTKACKFFSASLHL
jgi:hypothetical protein